MSTTSTSVFHLHYHVPNIDHAADVLEEVGLPVHARYGSVEGESIAIRPGEETPTGFQFRLQDAQRGFANVTLTPGPATRFDHIGVITPQFDSIVERSRGTGWTVTDSGEHRTFLHPPWGFRIEIHPPDGRVASSLGDSDACRFTNVRLVAPDHDGIRAGIERVFGSIPNLDISGTDGERPTVSRAVLEGQELPKSRRILTADALEPPS